MTSTTSNKYKLSIISKLTYRCGNAVCISDILFCDVRKVLRATSAMMDVPTCEQELPEPVTVTHSKPRALGEVPDEREKLGRIRHQRTT